MMPEFRTEDDRPGASADHPPGRPPDRPPRLALKASLLAVGFTLSLGFLGLFAGVVLERVTGWTGLGDTFSVVLGAVALLVAGVVAIRTAGRRVTEYVPMGVPGGRAWLAAAALGSGTVLFNMTLPVRLAHWMDGGYLQMLERMLDSLQGLVTPVGALVVLGLFIPLCEELFFRGVVLRSLLGRWNRWPAVLVAALVFAAFHLHPVHMVTAFALGVVAGWAMVATGTVWAAVAVHAVNNTLGVGFHVLAPDFEAAPLWVLVPALLVLGAGAALLRGEAPRPIP